MSEQLEGVLLRARFIASLEWMRHMDVEGECFELLGNLLTRFYIFHRKRAEGRRIFRIYIHKLLRSDAENVWHDHPWHFISIIIWNGYFEISPEGSKRIRPGMIIFRPARWKHRLELQGTAVTLVIAIGRSREWGFFVNGSQERIAVNKYDYASGRCE